MKIKVNGINSLVDVNNITDANLLGESLRNLFFGTEKGFGCYENFIVEPNVKYLGETKPDPESCELYKTYQLGSIKMMYYWDGDGTLIFDLGNGRSVINPDCKKDHNWEEYSDYMRYY